MSKKPTLTPPTPLLMTEEYWANSQLSVARYSGGIRMNGADYIIVDELGRDIYECSAIATREGRSHAIDPGAPADLVWRNLQPHYRTLGRDRILSMLKDGADFGSIELAAKQKLAAEKEARAAADHRRKAQAEAAERTIEFPYE